MIIHQKINAFKPTKKNQPLEYSERIKEAVLNPKITIKKLHLNGGWDWIDQRYGFIKLLISRGQILEIETHQDLMAHDDYLQAIKIGVQKSYSFSLHFTVGTGNGAFASEKRLNNAKAKWIEFANSIREAADEAINQ